jgi:hypothetical protein
MTQNKQKLQDELNSIFDPNNNVEPSAAEVHMKEFVNRMNGKETIGLVREKLDGGKNEIRFSRVEIQKKPRNFQKIKENLKKNLRNCRKMS